MSLLQFVEEERYVPSREEEERRNRIRLSLAAYTYEFESETIMSDGDFDELALKIDKDMPTGNELLDNFFKEHFNAYTGQWIHKHPELSKLKAMYFCMKNKGKPYLRVMGDIVIDYKKKKVVLI
jgi:hypothetical protein